MSITEVESSSNLLQNLCLALLWGNLKSSDLHDIAVVFKTIHHFLMVDRVSYSVNVTLNYILNIGYCFVVVTWPSYFYWTGKQALPCTCNDRKSELKMNLAT